MNYVRKLPTLQELILQLYEPWLCNIWCKLQYRAPGIVTPFEAQIAEIMKEVYSEDITWMIVKPYMRVYQLMKIRQYLKTRGGKVLEIANIYDQRYCREFAFHLPE